MPFIPCRPLSAQDRDYKIQPKKRWFRMLCNFVLCPFEYLFEFPRHQKRQKKKKRPKTITFHFQTVESFIIDLFWFFLIPACFFIQNGIIYALYFCKVVRLCCKCIDMWNRFAKYVIINRMSDQSVTWLKLSSRYCGSTKRKVGST